MKPLVLFDFDGTIANTFDALVRILNKHKDKYGYQKITPKIVEQLRDKSLEEVVGIAKIPKWKLFFIARRAKKELTAHLEKVPLVKGMGNTFRELRKNYRIGIMSSNSKKNVFKFLTLHGLKADEIYGGVSLFSKARKLRKLRPIVYVGDEARDVEACHKAKVPMIAVTWGFNSENALKNADYKAIKPAEILKILAKFGNKLK
jgi:phosphoglycolate phosphatase-like HAD superfamily hydrolase